MGRGPARRSPHSVRRASICDPSAALGLVVGKMDATFFASTIFCVAQVRKVELRVTQCKQKKPRCGRVRLVRPVCQPPECLRR
jgi:hypothetical protein